MIQRPPVVAVLDDEPRMRKALRRLLATHGFRVEAIAARGALDEAMPREKSADRIGDNPARKEEG